jgi:hypothetical protein
VMGEIGRFIHFLVSRFIICQNRIVIYNLSFTNFDVDIFLCRAPFSNPQFTEREGEKSTVQTRSHRGAPLILLSPATYLHWCRPRGPILLLPNPIASLHFSSGRLLLARV